jgi:hypothetical protein
MRADLILATIRELRDHGDAAVLRKIDFNNAALIGHSRGGEAAVYATKLNAALSNPLRIKAVMNISPSDLSRGCSAAARLVVPAGTTATTVLAPTPLTTVPLSLSAADGVRYLVLYGSHDGDISGDGDNVPATITSTFQRDGTGFSLYDRSTCDKTIIFVRGATHNRFNTKWNGCANYGDFQHSFVSGSCAAPSPTVTPDPVLLTPDQHKELAIFYARALLDRVLRSDAPKERILRGETAPSGPTIVVQFAPASRLDVDNFASATNPNRTISGGGLIESFTVAHCPQESTVYRGSTGDKVRVRLPAPVNLRAQRRTSLTMRIGAQYTVPSAAVIAGEPKPAFTARITSGATSTVSAATDHDVTTAGALEPDRPFFHRLRTGVGNATKLHFDTVVLPLSAFRPAIDEARVSAVEIEVGSGGTTPMFIDSIAFV